MGVKPRQPRDFGSTGDFYEVFTLLWIYLNAGRRESISRPTSFRLELFFSSCCHLPAVGPGGLRWGFFFFGWDSWLIGLRFVFGAWGGSLGASVRADVRVCLAGSGRFYLECTAGGPVVYMGRDKNGRTGQGIFSSVQFSSVTHWGRVPSVHGTCYPVLAWSIQLRAYAMPSVPVQCPRLHH